MMQFSRFARFHAGVVFVTLCLSTDLAQQPKTASDLQKDAPMAVDASPSFEVAAIRPSDPNDPKAANGWNCESEGHRLGCKQATALDLISLMYSIQPKQISGGPAWMAHDRYDISGVPDMPGVPSPDQLRLMYRKLFAERFGLQVHTETRTMPIYALTVDKGGPRLKPADPSEPVNAGNYGGSSQREIRFTSMSMPEFARNLDIFEDRPVVDRTALTGRYDFTLRWTYDLAAESQPGAPPSLFTALREQLGLRMDAVKGEAEVMVIDRLERPTGN